MMLLLLFLLLLLLLLLKLPSILFVFVVEFFTFQALVVFLLS